MAFLCLIVPMKVGSAPLSSMSGLMMWRSGYVSQRYGIHIPGSGSAPKCYWSPTQLLSLLYVFFWLFGSGSGYFKLNQWGCITVLITVNVYRWKWARPLSRQCPDCDVHPGSGSWLFTHPGSRGQKGTGSRIRIRNTDSKLNQCAWIPVLITVNGFFYA